MVSRAIAAIAKSSGPGAAKSTRACLSGMFGVAIQDGAIAVNPVRDSVARFSTGKKSPRALTIDETAQLVGWLRANDHAISLDIPDLVDWMLATGCRIGEALALRYGTNADGRPLLDLDAGTWEVNATVVRIAAQGLTVQSRPKTAAGWRVVALPEFAVRMVRERRTWRASNGVDPPVFTTPLAGGLRDPNNVSGDLRQLLDSFDCDVCARTGFQLDEDGFVQGRSAWATAALRRGTVVVGHVPHIPQDRGDPA